jgi:outer membrane protein assembly factor BamB
MCRLFKYSFILAAAFLFFPLTHNSFAGMDNSGQLVSPELLKAANLKLLWEEFLPLKKSESMERMLILGDQIYLISSRNFTMALDRQTGQKIFNRNITYEGLTASGFEIYNDEIIYVVDSSYTELEIANGNEKKTTNVGFGISAPVVRNDSFFYVSGVDNRLHVFKADERVETFKVAAENNSLITSVCPGSDYIVFGTNKGNIYSMLPDSPKSLWKIDAAGGLVGQITRDNNDLFFSSDDMNVYRINVPTIYTKNIVWKTLIPGIVQQSPRVTKTMVYQSAFGKEMSLSAIDKDTGKLIWTVPGGIELLAESRGKAYVITEDSRLVVMNNVSTKQVYSVNFTGITRQAFNTLDSKIYIGNKAGRIACLEPLN